LEERENNRQKKTILGRKWKRILKKSILGGNGKESAKKFDTWEERENNRLKKTILWRKWKRIG
jgi:hypothetical protein